MVVSGNRTPSTGEVEGTLNVKAVMNECSAVTRT